MLKSLFFLVWTVATACATGGLTVLHHPSSLDFKGHDSLKESILKEVLSASLGFSTEQFSNWQGFYINDPFNLAEASVTVAVEGVANIGLAKGHHFPLKTDENEQEIFDSLQERVSQRYPESRSNLVRVDLDQGLEQVQQHRIFHSIKSDKPKKSGSSHLKSHVDEDREFLKEVHLLNAITEKIEQNAVTPDNIPDIFWFKISGLHALSDLYGENSTQVKEAKQLLNEAIIRLNNAFTKAYKGRVLVTVVTSDAVHTRRGRSILQAKAEEPINPADINLAKDYSPDYPVIFNIMLWFSVAMVFSLLAICIAIAEMDPGRDSIIYRMTTSRMKKDN